MAVKVCINGQMKKIDTALHKPVIFLNGQKKVLSKAWTFVNGEKKMLWGQEGVQVDYIKANGLLSGYSKIIAIGDDWAVVNSTRTYFDYVNRLDISNLSSPTLVQQVAWGTVVGNWDTGQDGNGYNGYKSEQDSKYYFNARARATGNELSIDPQTGEVLINDSFSKDSDTNDGAFEGKIDSYFVYIATYRRQTSLGAFYTSSAYYFNNSKRYTTGSVNTPYIYFDGQFLQSGNGEGLAVLNDGIYSMTYNAITKKSSALNLDLLMMDGSYVVGQVGNKFGLYTTGSLTEFRSYTAPTGYDLLFVGKIGSNYYVVEHKSDAAKIVVLNDTSMAMVWEKELPVDPFEDGVDFWAGARTLPIISKNGFLGVSYNDSGRTRIARFSELLN